MLGIAIEPSPSIIAPSVGRSGADGARHALFWGSTWLCRISLDAPVGWGGFAKKRRRDGSSHKQKGKSRSKSITDLSTKRAPRKAVDGDEAEVGLEDEDISNFKLVTRYRPILRADFLDAGELLVVERPLLDVLRGLPPAFFKPRYGT